MICGTRWHMRLKKQQKRHWESQKILDLGVKNLGGRMILCRVKFESKEIVLKIGLGVKMLKLGVNMS